MGFAPDQVMRMSAWEFAAVCDAHSRKGGGPRPMSEADIDEAQKLLDAAPAVLRD